MAITCTATEAGVRQRSRAMNEYIYIISNVSMPGLLKVGRTSNAPSKRMSELHTTSVPTPFELEVAFQVSDSAYAERRIHQLLDSFRVAKNREFFRIGVAEAAETAINSFSDFKLFYAKKSHGIVEIEQAFREERTEKEKQQTEKLVSKLSALKSKGSKVAEEVKSLQAKKRVLNSKLASLGARPKKPELEPPLSYYWVVQYPLPVGFIFYVGMFQIFNPDMWFYGAVCIAIMAAAWWASSKDKEIDIEFEKRNKNHQVLDTELEKLDPQLQNKENELVELRDQYSSTKNVLFTSEKVNAHQLAVTKYSGQDVLTIKKNDSVWHPEFLQGTVIEMEGNGSHARARIDFTRSGEKWLMLAYTDLYRINA